MEKHSALASKKLGVGVEQVSIFLTADNTVIAFFEHSADDIEEPILPRLRTEETILRRTSDASMLTQAILDAIIDMAVSLLESLFCYGYLLRESQDLLWLQHLFTTISLMRSLLSDPCVHSLSRCYRRAGA